MMITEENNNNNNNTSNTSNTNTVLTDIKEETIDFDTSLTDDNDSNSNSNNIEDDGEDDNKTIQHSTMIVMSSDSSSNNSSVIIHQQDINNNDQDDRDNTINDDSMNKSLKDGEISIPLSTSSITVDKFVSNEELALLPPLPNALDLQLDTQNLTNSLTNSNSSNNEITLQNNNNNNTVSTNIGTDSFTPISLTPNSTSDNEVKNLILLTQDTDNNNTTTASTSPQNNNNNDIRIPHTMMNLSQGSPIILTPLSEDNTSSPTDFNNAINTSFDLSKAFEMSSSSTPNGTTENNNGITEINTAKKITNVFQEHKKVESTSSSTLSHKSSSILTKRISNKSITPIDQDQQQQHFLKNEEKLYQVSNINNQTLETTTTTTIPQEKQIDLSADVYIPYVSDSLQGLGVSDLTPLSTQSIINQNSINTPSTPVPTKKIPFLRRASSTLLRKASMKSLSRQESNSIPTPRSSGTTPIMASPSQFDNNSIVRTRSNSILQETNTARRKPTMKRNVSFGSKMKRSISRIVSNSISNSTENITNNNNNNNSTSTSTSNDLNTNLITPTNSIQPQLYNTQTIQTQYSSSHIQSPLEVIRHTHSYTPTSVSSITNERLHRTSTNQIRIPHLRTTSKDHSLNSDRKFNHESSINNNNQKFIELDTTILKDNNLLPATNITDQILNDSKTLDKIIQQSKLSLLPSSYGSNTSLTSSNSNNSNNNKQDIKLEKLSVKEYLQLLKNLKDEEINQYDTIIKNLEIHGWYSDQEINNMIKKKDLLEKLWNDRISFYQNQI